jgi:hypothetical protein
MTNDMSGGSARLTRDTNIEHESLRDTPVRDARFAHWHPDPEQKSFWSSNSDNSSRLRRIEVLSELAKEICDATLLSQIPKW